MQWIIPGTTLTGQMEETEHIEQQFGSMFLAGGMVLSQVCSITGLEAYMVQNWVKRGFLPKPDQKRYDLNQLCRIINIQMLKRVLSMESIVGLLSYINGHLDDTSDDLIDDSKLYFMFVRVCAASQHLQSKQDMEERIHQVMQSYESPIPGAKERVEKVLRIMLTAWITSKLHDKVERMMAQL